MIEWVANPCATHFFETQNSMKNIFSLMALLLCAQLGIAQTSLDALRYSYLDAPMTARSLGVGGAMSGLGGDISSITVNPAGIGSYWKSELSLGVSYEDNLIQAGFNGRNSDRISSRLFFENGGFVMTEANPNRKWQSVSFGITFNKRANLGNDIFFQGNSQGSIVERFAGLALDLDPNSLDDFEAGLAYETGAIYDFEEDNIYETDYLDNENEVLFHEQLLQQTGSVNELSFTLGGNYLNKLSVGLSIGIPFISYTGDKFYVEDDPDDNVPFFNSLQFNESLQTTGGGVNLKLGGIYKLEDIRLGLAVHTPTFYTLTDDFSTDLTYSFQDGEDNNRFSSESPLGEFEYGLNTPWKAIGSLAYVNRKFGFISGEVELVDYGSTRFNFTRNSDDPGDAQYENQINSEIKETYTTAVNLRVGAEFVWDAFRARVGYSSLGNPFAESSILYSSNSYSAGVGYRGNSAFIDFAFVHQNRTQDYAPYLLRDAIVPTANVDQSNNRFTLTVGFKI